ncbi:MAG TPA: hypothetical protein ENN45_05260 [Bacteroidetes bacterium]|nr:hypothetical protein [Bacteroidota bacterium]
MKPVKSALPLAKWLFRIAILTFISYHYKEEILTWNFKNLEYITILGITFFAILLFIGGFLKSSSISVISGLLIFLLAILKLILDYPDGLNTEMFLFIVLGFYFFASGNYYYLKN